MIDSPLFFLHITKTAGGTLKSALGEGLSERVRFAYGGKQIAEITQQPLDGVAVVYGHFMYGLHREMELPPRYACFIRHPMVRVISHYYHLRNVERGAIGEKIRQSEDINDFFDRYSHWEFSNLMARIIAGQGPAPPNNQKEIFRLASENLSEHFDFVGFQEQFPYSLRRLEQLLDARLPVRRNVNVGSYKLDGVSDRTIEMIREANQADLALYKFCVKRFLD